MRDPRVTEWWQGQIIMIAHCDGSRYCRVYESLDMGTMWKEAVRRLPGIWVNAPSGAYQKESLRVEALITATIEGRKVMLYTHKTSHPLEASEPNALYLWVTDNNRTLHIGPVSVDGVVNKSFDNTLLYSDGALHLLQAKGDHESTDISLARLTDELNTINSTLSTWARLDTFFSKSSISTAGLVAALSNAAGDDTWIDD
ncbi:trans-sialidase [Trypanosoma cruzi]|nr:trans-sialidase [Trypanosoma cruzi]